MPSTDLHEDRLARVKRAAALENQDRVPVVLEYAGFAARATATPLPEFLLNLERSVEVMMDAWRLVTAEHPADAINYGRFSPYNLCPGWMSKVAVPGVDLDPEASYQVVEEELLKPEDYDDILKLGWPRFQRQYLEERIFKDTPPQYLPWNQPNLDIRGRWAEMDVPVLKGATVAPPFEYLCGGRTLAGFSFDLIKTPDKVIEVMDEMIAHESQGPLQATARLGYSVAWVGGWRTAPAMLSPQMWEKFVWPYFKRLILEVIEAGLIPLLHLDGDWERELPRFLDLPAGKMIFGLDGYTDIFKAKEILDGHSCIQGDVPAALLYDGTPEEVYEYSARLVRELGPRGFILHSGCDIPENAKLENVKAMIAAAAG